MASDAAVALDAHSAVEWAELASSSFVPLSVDWVEPEFVGRVVTGHRSPRARIATVETNMARVRRTPRLVRSEPRDSMLIIYRETGGGLTTQTGHSVSMGSGTLLMYPTDKPYDMSFTGPAREVVLQMARPALASALGRQPGHGLVEVGGAGMARRLLAHCLCELAAADRSDDLALAVSEQVLSTALGLLGLLLPDTPAPQSPYRHAAVLAVMKQFVGDHLHDPDLTRAAIAAAHNVSERYVTMVFEAEGVGPAAYIRRQRLARAHDVLRADLHRSSSISLIAHQSGFRDATTFARAFKRAYGYQPRQAREAARGAENWD